MCVFHVDPLYTKSILTFPIPTLIVLPSPSIELIPESIISGLSVQESPSKIVIKLPVTGAGGNVMVKLPPDVFANKKSPPDAV